jgi:hypothetical protein
MMIGYGYQHLYSRWICPGGHVIDREPLDEDTFVYCIAFVPSRDALCGRRMWRKLVVEINVGDPSPPVVSGDPE